MLGHRFPVFGFLPGGDVKKVQIDRNPKHIGRRTAVDLGLVGDIKATVTAVAPHSSAIRAKPFPREACRGHNLVP